MKILVFGTSNCAVRFMKEKLKTGIEIVGFLDNNIEKQGKLFFDLPIISPLELNDYEFDYIVIASQYRYEIVNQLKDMGIGYKRCIPADPEIYIMSESSYTKLDEILDLSYQKRPIKKFEKGKVEIDNYKPSETSKARRRRLMEDFFVKYCNGEGLDIGYGKDILLPECSGWEIENGDAQYLTSIEDESFDYVYSSHCLEHMMDPNIALQNWWRVLRKNGYLLLYIPHRDLYEKRKMLPSKWNFDHKNMFLLDREEVPDTLSVLKLIRENCNEYEIQYARVCDYGHTITDPDTHSDGEYSIEVVIKKI